MAKAENALLGKFLAELRRRHPEDGQVLKLSDGMTKGVPDFELTANGKTSWGEAKYTEIPGIISLKGSKLQLLTMQVKARYGLAAYLIWELNALDGSKSVSIVDPLRIRVASNKGCYPTMMGVEGWDPRLIVGMWEERWGQR